MLVVSSAQRAEQALLALGQLDCPDCGGVLRAYGHARTRTVRGLGAERLRVTPRRSRCAECHTSHVLLPTALSVRRADSSAAIGTALLAKANGAGHRAIAARLGRPVSTLRCWLRAVPLGHAEWLYQAGVARAARLDPGLLATPKPAFKSTLWHALNILGAAARCARERFGCTDSPWSLIGLYARGRLLARPPSPA